ncbi:MAG TPA: cytochrome c [Acidimicrobiia bacterium]|nr:cytochrome c [Acidimicrobiia bacterium]
MRSWWEAVLALAVVLALGAGLFFFSGGTLGQSTTTTPVVVDTEAAARGEALATQLGCLACHSTDGTPGVGPTWKGLAGSSRPLASGESVVADDAYLLNSIVEPAEQVVAGFDPIMPPDYGETLSEQEISDLVEYIRSLSS